jgi:hypothetical protein
MATKGSASQGAPRVRTHESIPDVLPTVVLHGYCEENLSPGARLDSPHPVGSQALPLPVAHPAKALSITFLPKYGVIRIETSKSGGRAHRAAHAEPARAD